MNGYEQLLHWAAEVGAGTFDRFSAAHAWATGEEVAAMDTLRLMTAVGYLEVDWAGRRWAAVNPTITLLPDAGGYGLVVGARTEKLTRELIAGVDDPDVFVDAHEQWRAPDTCFVAADSEGALERLAAKFSLPFVHSVTDRLAEVLPSLDVLLHKPEPAIAQHYGVDRYDLGRGFRAADDDRSAGFYRYEISGPRRMQFQAEDGLRYHVDLAVGAWAEARRLAQLGHIWWRPDGTNGTLLTPWRMPLPALHARTAALCSGLAPYETNDGVNYVNVPERLAARIATSLGQELMHR